MTDWVGSPPLHRGEPVSNSTMTGRDLPEGKVIKIYYEKLDIATSGWITVTELLTQVNEDRSEDWVDYTLDDSLEEVVAWYIQDGFSWGIGDNPVTHD